MPEKQTLKCAYNNGIEIQVLVLEKMGCIDLPNIQLAGPAGLQLLF